jgi:hypothetical protein
MNFSKLYRKNFQHSGKHFAFLTLSVTLISGIYLASCKDKKTDPSVMPVLFESDNNLFGYKDSDGNILIEPKYAMAYEFTKKGVAQVVTEYDWFCIDNTGKPLLKIFNYDNGPDYYEEGLARYVDDKNKMGFMNEKCEIIIPAKYDFAWPFEKGSAQVCDGCSKTIENEMLKISGGKNYNINKKGEIVSEK